MARIVRGVVKPRMFILVFITGYIFLGIGNMRKQIASVISLNRRVNIGIPQHGLQIFKSN